MSLAALEATSSASGRAGRLTVLRMIEQDEDTLRARAERLLHLVGEGRVESSEGFAGGGSLPEERMRSFSLSLPRQGVPTDAALLRSAPRRCVPVQGRSLLAESSQLRTKSCRSWQPAPRDARMKARRGRHHRPCRPRQDRARPRFTGQETDRPAEGRDAASRSRSVSSTHAGGRRRDRLDRHAGHERFVRTMIGGATGIDAVLLVVAANEGVMPQTIEHVDIAAGFSEYERP